VEIITKAGKKQVLYNSFPGRGEPIEFGWAALGTGSTQPTPDDDKLSDECSDSEHGGYHRVAVTPYWDDENTTVMLEAVFDQENIQNSAVIREIAIFSSEEIGEGVPICICQIAPFTKSHSVQLKIDVIITLDVE
jgi:hypothetical protein